MIGGGEVPAWVRAFFGDPWPSGVCDEGKQVDTPVGQYCVMCEEIVREGERGSFMGIAEMPYYGPVHRECSLRGVLGGIGHLQDHLRWCVQEHDPDGGLSYRKSALLVWEWVQEKGFPRDEP